VFVNIQKSYVIFLHFQIFPCTQYINVCLDQVIDANSLHTQFHYVVGLFATSPTSKGSNINYLNTTVNLNYI